MAHGVSDVYAIVSHFLAFRIRYYWFTTRVNVCAAR